MSQKEPKEEINHAGDRFLENYPQGDTSKDSLRRSMVASLRGYSSSGTDPFASDS
jgi:hypothetical protein